MKKNKQARLDALEAAYLAQHDHHKRLVAFCNGMFDLVTQLHEGMERLEASEKCNLNAIANLNMRLITIGAELGEWEERVRGLEKPEAGPAQKRLAGELADQKIRGWEKAAAKACWGDSEITEDIKTVEAWNAHEAQISDWLVKKQADWLAKHPDEPVWDGKGQIPGRYK